MARVFNLQVVKATLIGGPASPVYSDPELNATLGTADTLFTQIYVDGVANSATDVTVNVEGSNDGVSWDPSLTPKVVSVTTAGAGPSVAFTTFPNQAAFSRFVVSASKDNAIVRVIACGRSM
ncbi:MAG: hypothetical protein R3A48_11225 [Polyangiales bacterium]